MTKTLKKEERLSAKKAIEELFNRGSYFYLYPFKIIYKLNSSPLNQVIISVSSRNFKRAVDRNKLKRRIREAYRLNKNELGNKKNWLIAYIYTPKEIVESKIIHEKMILAMRKLNEL